MKSASQRITFTPAPELHELVQSKALEEHRTVTGQLNHILQDWKARADAQCSQAASRSKNDRK